MYVNYLIILNPSLNILARFQKKSARSSIQIQHPDFCFSKDGGKSGSRGWELFDHFENILNSILFAATADELKRLREFEKKKKEEDAKIEELKKLKLRKEADKQQK